MKIDEMNQQAAVAYVNSVRAERQPESAEAHGDSAAKQQRTTDKVDLSGYIPVAPEARDEQAMRESRLADLKAQIANGTYNVSSHAVAEKMLSKIVM